MKLFSLFALVAGMLSAAVSQAQTWPTNLAGLSKANQILVLSKVRPSVGLEKFTQWKIERTVGEHALVHYGFQFPEVCTDGTIAQSFENVTLFVDALQLKDVTHWLSHGCKDN